MREMTSTEAARNFRAVLDDTKNGETTVITRGGERVAVLSPAPRANGSAFRDLITRWRGSDAFTDDFAANVAAARATADHDLDSDPWHD